MAALERHLKTVLGKDTPENVVAAMVARLDREGIVMPKGKKLEYKIPDKKT